MPRNIVYKFFIHVHLLPIILVPGIMWIISGYHKFSSIVTGAAWGPAKDAWIPWLSQHFSGIPILSYHPMVVLSFFVMTALQVATGIYYIIGVVRGEFIVGRGKQWLSTATILAIINIALLSFGQNLANDNIDIFELMSYFAAHLICLFYINFVSEDFFLRNRK